MDINDIDTNKVFDISKKLNIRNVTEIKTLKDEVLDIKSELNIIKKINTQIYQKLDFYRKTLMFLGIFLFLYFLVLLCKIFIKG